jgi:Mitochondrial carrier protein
VLVVLHAPDAVLSGSVAGFVSTVAGLLAGVAAAIVSHPGDTILSRVNQEQGDGADAFAHIQRVVRAAGPRGLFSGLSVRIIQVACMIGGQFLIYDTIKLFCGIVPASAIAQAPQAFIAAGVGAALAKGAPSLASAGIPADAGSNLSAGSKHI